VSVPWIALLVVAAVVVVAAEWPRVGAVVGADARRRRDRARRKAKLHVVRNEPDEVSAQDEFAASVRRDLDRLPTIEESESGRRDA
jgi:hypothetical protein